MKSSKLLWSILLGALGITLSVLPTVLAILCYFPVWVAEGGETVLSGFTATLLAVAVFPLYRLLKKLLESPSTWVMWLIAFILFYLLSHIADEMTVISFVGTVSNILGAVVFRIRRRVCGDEKA